jgi:4-amino-4-deoxy-L-arabinose transferase-like glycosyltransferase
VAIRSCVYHRRIITTDVPVTFFVVLAVWFCWDVFERGRWRITR